MALPSSRAQEARGKPVCPNIAQVHVWVFFLVVAIFLDAVQGSLEYTELHHAAIPQSRQLRSQPPKFPDQTGPILIDISGPFEMEIKLRIDSFDSSCLCYNSVLNLSNGGLADTIFLGAYGNPNVLVLMVYKNGSWSGVTANNVLVLGQERTYVIGIDANGTSWVNMDGTRVATGSSAIPNAVSRTRRWFGSSDFSNTRNLRGAILGLRITNKDENERDLGQRQFLTNLPGQIFGPFRSGLYVQVDNTTAIVDQGVVDFYTTNGVDNVRIVSNRRNMRFELYQGGTLYSVTASNSVVAGEMALWTIGVDSSNTMFLEKNGSRLGTRSIPSLTNVLRRTTVFGNVANGTAPLDGVTLGFRTEAYSSS